MIVTMFLLITSLSNHCQIWILFEAQSNSIHPVFQNFIVERILILMMLIMVCLVYCPVK